MGAMCCGDKVEPVPIVTKRVSETVVPRAETPIPPVMPEYVEPKAKSPPMPKMPPFTNIGISTTNPLKLIEGYEDEPLVSLEEALKPFEGEIDQLSYYIEEAETKCHKTSAHNLTDDESAAIYIYTMKWDDTCLYDHLQAAWKSEDRSKLKPWFKYLRLFKSAFDKLPDAKTEIWQGELFNERLKEQLSSNSLSLYSSMGLCSSSEKEVKEYLEEHVTKHMLLAGYKNVGGKSMTGYAVGGSNQVMVFPGMKLGVSNFQMYGDYGSIIFHLTGPTIDKRPKSIKTPVIEKHFECRNDKCDNRCRRNHDPNHCYGFAFLYHNCQHHCGPTMECFCCGQHLIKLLECNKCQSRYCEKCCYK